MPLNKSVCANLSIKFIIKNEIHDLFILGTPACILFTQNASHIKNLEGVNSFKKFYSVFPRYPTIYKNCFLSNNVNGIAEFLFDDLKEVNYEVKNQNKRINELQKMFLDLNSKDSLALNKSINRYLRIQNILALNGRPLLIMGSAKEAISISRVALSSLALDYTYYPFIKKYFGFSVGFDCAKINGLISQNNLYLIDTIDRSAFDSKDYYTRISYGENIKEYFSIKTASISFGLNFNVFMGLNSKFGLTINPGIKISNVLTAKYNATAGLISWGGLYLNPKYENNDTSFSGQYEFYQNKPIYKEMKNLEVNNTFLSGFISIYGFYSPFKVTKNKELSKFYFNVGLTFEKSSNVLNNNKKESVLPYTIGDYNSLLYRSEKLNLNTFILKIGLSYKL